MPEGEFYNQIKYLVLIGIMHSLIIVVLTEWIKGFIPDYRLTQRLFPLLWSITVTFISLPSIVDIIGIKIPPTDSYVVVIGLLLAGITGAGGAFAIYNLWDLMRVELLNALKKKVDSWSSK